MRINSVAILPNSLKKPERSSKSHQVINKYTLKPAFQTLSMKVQYLLRREFLKTNFPDIDLTNIAASSVEYREFEGSLKFRISAFGLFGGWMSVSEFRGDQSDIFAFSNESAYALARVLLTQYQCPIIIFKNGDHVDTLFS